MNPNAVPVALVDDHPLFRRGLKDCLNESARFQVVQDFASGDALLAELDELDVQLLLLDLQMPDVSGLDILKEIKRLWPTTAPELKGSGLNESGLKDSGFKHNELKIVILTASDDSQHLFEALRQGADGYLLKDTHPDEIVRQLLAVLDGQVAINGQSVTSLVRHLHASYQNSSAQASVKANPVDWPTDNAATPALSGLDEAEADLAMTEREQQTLELIAQGMSNKLIARALGISDGTVKVYVKNLLRKLNLHSRLELAAWVHTQGKSGIGH